MRKQHSFLEEPIKCRFCDEVFHDRYNLMTHQRTHSRGRAKASIKKMKQNSDGTFTLEKAPSNLPDLPDLQNITEDYWLNFEANVEIFGLSVSLIFHSFHLKFPSSI